MVFVSWDRLHRNCARHFLRADQEFVWGPELNADLARINQHFSLLPEQEKGIIAFASTAPDLEGSLARRLRARHLRPGIDDPPQSTQRRGPADQELVRELNRWKDAPEVRGHSRDLMDREPDMLTIERRVAKKRGSWWQLPKDLAADTDESPGG
jgi:hypothetical protein